MKIAVLIGTVFRVGYIRPAPGTWGSLISLPYAWLLHVLGGLPLLILGVCRFCQWLVGHRDDDRRVRESRPVRSCRRTSLSASGSRSCR